MKVYFSEERAELKFSFPDDLDFYNFDEKGQKLPIGMKLVDLVINREKDVLLVEIKDPSNSLCHDTQRENFLMKLKDNSIISENLAPKARGSYTFLHLMKQDSKPFIYVVLLGLDSCCIDFQKALLMNFKDRLHYCICNEAYKPWEFTYIKDCLVLSVDGWNDTFPLWHVERINRISIGG